MNSQNFLNRRDAIRNLAIGGTSICGMGIFSSLVEARFFAAPGRMADELEKTPRVGAGPFYPDKLPLDTDNDLLIVNDSITPAVGQVTHLTGRVLDTKGSPIRNATVEIWECDHNGVYLHTRASSRRKIDGNFQGYGRFLTGSKGQYYFRTIKPVPYASRTAPHIHFAVSSKGKQLLTTEMLIKDHAGNAKDPIHRGVDASQRSILEVPFEKIKDSKIGELTANFDIVLGATPPIDD